MPIQATATIQVDAQLIAATDEQSNIKGGTSAGDTEKVVEEAVSPIFETFPLMGTQTLYRK